MKETGPRHWSEGLVQKTRDQTERPDRETGQRNQTERPDQVATGTLYGSP